MWASRAAQEDQVVSTTIRILAALMRTNEGARQLSAVLLEVFPWVQFLPSQDLDTFAREFVDVARATSDLHNPAPLVQLINEWRHTAEVHADPALYEILAHSVEDHGPVTLPGVTA